MDIPASHSKLVELDETVNDNTSSPSKKTLHPVRDYRLVSLDDQTPRVLLVCDPRTEKAALSTCVGHAGQLHDGADWPGRAHLLEHLLFLGSEAFPNENELDSYLTQHGGHSNAYTDLELTCYYMDCSTQALEGALARWSAALKAPLLKESVIEREIQAVDSEHAKNQPQDYWRSYQLSKTLLSEHSSLDNNHPYGHFGSGCLASLLPGEEGDKEARIAALREAVLDFWTRHYTTDQISICVLSSHSLDEQEALVQKYFADLPTRRQPANEDNNSRLGSPVVRVPPLPPLPKCRRVEFVPLRPVYSLELHWVMPEIRSQYKQKPTQVLSHLLGDEGPGSLLHVLRHEQPWVQELAADHGSRASASFSIFILQLELTPTGWEHVNEIIAVICHYIQTFLQSQDLPPHIYHELQLMGDMAFDFMSIPSSAADTVSTLAVQMFEYDNPNHVLSGMYKYFAESLHQESLRNDYCNGLNPEHMLVMVGAPEYGQDASKNKDDWQTDAWYGTQYRVTEVDAETIALWKNPTSDTVQALTQQLHLPKPNEFLPSDFTLVEPMPTHFVKPDSPPVCIHNDKRVQLWYKPDTAFSMPKVNLFVSFPVSGHHNAASSSILATLWGEWQNEVANAFSYPASMAGLHGEWVANPKRGTVELHVSGYSHKATLLGRRLLETCVAAAAESSQVQEESTQAQALDEELWQRLKQKLRDQYHGFFMAQSYQHAIYFLDQCLEAVPEPKSIEQCLVELDALTRDDLLHFHNKAFLPSTGLQVMVHGNITSVEALEFAQRIPEILRPNNKNGNNTSTSPDAEATAEETTATSSVTSAESASLTTTKPTIQQRIVKLEANSNYKFAAQTKWNQENTNHCALLYFPVGMVDLETNASLSLLKHLMVEPTFNQLRTQEQLGYIVHSQLKTLGDHIKGLVLLVQGEAKDPAFMEGRMRHFFQAFRTQLVDMAPSEFAQHKQSLYETFMERRKNLLQESAAHWGVITNQSFHFTRILEIAGHIQTRTKEDILRLLDKCVLYGSSLAIRMLGHGEELSNQQDEDKSAENGVSLDELQEPQTTIISDPLSFGRTQSLYPLPEAAPVSVTDLGSENTDK